MVSILTGAAVMTSSGPRRPKRAAVLTHPGWRALLSDVDRPSPPAHQIDLTTYQILLA